MLTFRAYMKALVVLVWPLAVSACGSSGGDSNSSTGSGALTAVLSVLPPCAAQGAKWEIDVPQVAGTDDYYRVEITDVSTLADGATGATFSTMNKVGTSTARYACYADRIEARGANASDYEPPYDAIRVPLYEGNSWDSSFTVAGTSIDIHRTVLGTATVDVPLGTFEAAVIRSETTYNGNVDVTDAYVVDAIGTVKIEGMLGGAPLLQEMVSFALP